MVTTTNTNNPITEAILSDVAYRWHDLYGDEPIPAGVTRYVAGFPVHPANIMPPALGGDFELLCNDMSPRRGSSNRRNWSMVCCSTAYSVAGPANGPGSNCGRKNTTLPDGMSAGGLRAVYDGPAQLDPGATANPGGLI